MLKIVLCNIKKIYIQRADPVLQGRLLVYVGLWPWGVPCRLFRLHNALTAL